MINTKAQTGLNFQGVARTTNNVILASQAMTIKLSILQGSSTGTADYVETRRVTTNAQGLFTAVIGDTGAINALGNFTTINWKLTPKFLKIEMDPTAGTNFITMGTTQFQFVAYAQFAKSVDAENILGIVPVTLGGTGVNSLTALKTALTLNNVNNTTDLTKPISTLTQTALDLKLSASDTSKYTKKTYIDSALLTKATQTALDLKLSASDTSKYTKKTYIDSALLTKLNTTGNAATATTATKLAIARTINGVAFDGTADISITSIADAGTLTGTTLKSSITNSSLTSVGTIANLTTGTITNSGKVIVGASSAASASAVLEASSTTQGFLPPRMTKAQRDAISSPASGLLVWCNNCGAVGEIQVFSETATWTNLSGTAPAGVYTPTIGASYQGGKVAYILASGDPGYDANIPHGLIASTSDLNNSAVNDSGVIWNKDDIDILTGAKETSIGSGLANTNQIIKIQGTSSKIYAAALARDYKGGGYTDWYLPSKDELIKLYINRVAIGGFVTETMARSRYWSSSEINEGGGGSAWTVDFYFGSSGNNGKSGRYNVRAIRAF